MLCKPLLLCCLREEGMRCFFEYLECGNRCIFQSFIYQLLLIAFVIYLCRLFGMSYSSVFMVTIIVIITVTLWIDQSWVWVECFPGKNRSWWRSISRPLPISNRRNPLTDMSTWHLNPANTLDSRQQIDILCNIVLSSLTAAVDTAWLTDSQRTMSVGIIAVCRSACGYLRQL